MANRLGREALEDQDKTLTRGKLVDFNQCRPALKTGHTVHMSV